MTKNTILTALVALLFAGTIFVPVQAADQSTISDYKDAPILIAQVYHDYAQEAAAEAEWQRRNGSFPYKDQLGRAYGPSGYAPSGLGLYGGVYANPYGYGMPNVYTQQQLYLQRQRLKQQRKYQRQVRKNLNRLYRAY